MAQKFRWKINNSMILCESYEDLGLIVKLYNGEIKYNDGATSRFDFLILSGNELERIQDQTQEKRRGTRKTR